MKFKILCLIMAATFILSSCGLKNKSNIPASSQVSTTTANSNESGSSSGSIEDSNTKTNETPSKTTETPGNTEQSTTDTSSLNKAEKSWYYVVKTNGEPSGEPADILTLINKYSAYYLGDTSKKVLYLTFDEGYENGYTSKILDILKENNVKAAFFVTKPYITANKDLIKRMVDEGHLVCNHSNTHPSMPSVALKGKTAFNKEFTDTEAAYKEITGTDMPKFFRPPMGNYSELSLYYTKSLGYKSIFWSFAYRDWETDKQPTESYAVNLMRERTHNGAILLLHAVSKTNTNVLDSMLKEWVNKGYEFKTLNELPSK